MKIMDNNSTRADKKILSFVLNNLSLISMFNRVKEFSFKDGRFTLTVANNGTDQMEWDSFKHSLAAIRDLVETSKIVKQDGGAFVTVTVTFKRQTKLQN